MKEQEPALLKEHVITRARNGRCYYDPKAKQALIRYAVVSGESISILAHKHGVAVALLRRWVLEYEIEHNHQPASVQAVLPSAAFVPVTIPTPAVTSPSTNPPQFSAKLPNGIEINLTGEAAVLSSLLETLWRLPCSASMGR
jgi:transposase